MGYIKPNSKERFKAAVNKLPRPHKWDKLIEKFNSMTFLDLTILSLYVGIIVYLIL